jgi:hypothetical protein
MVMLAHPNPRPNMPQRVLPIEERDPRLSDTAEYLNRLHEYIAQSLGHLRDSQIKALDSDFAPLDHRLDRLTYLDVGWDGYGAPAPTLQAVHEAREVLRQLQEELITPQRLSASAEGGIAFSFKASGDRRAQIEILNSGEKFVHLYDLIGNSYTHDWSEIYGKEPFSSLLKPLLTYIQL